MTKFVQNQEAKNGALNLGTGFWTFKLGLVAFEPSKFKPFVNWVVTPWDDGCEYGNAVNDWIMEFVVFWVVAMFECCNLEWGSEVMNEFRTKYKNLKQWVAPTNVNVIKIVTNTPKYIWNDKSAR